MKIKRLRVSVQNRVLVDISLEIKETLALVGQSGSGKSLTLKALLGMLPAEMDVELEVSAPFELRAGESVALVPQNPFTALSPLTRIKKQFFVSRKRIEYLFGEVGLEPALLERFPAELSGGQLQRVVLAMALERSPKLLLLDEPTTALDWKTTNLILELLKKLRSEMGFLTLFVTHDITSAALICNEIAVINEGKIVEQGSAKEILLNPKEAYTKRLIEANFANRKFRK